MKGWHYVLLGLLSYVFFLALSLPVSVFWQSSLVHNQLGALPLGVSELKGRLWQGSATIHYGEETYPVNWRMSAQALWRGELVAELNSEHPDLTARATVFMSPFSLGVRGLQANIGDEFINSHLADLGVKMHKPVFVNVQNIRWNHHVFTEAVGRLSWEGGTVRYPGGQTAHDANLPRLLADLTVLPDGQLSLSMVAPDQSDTDELLVLRLSGQGLGSVQVRRRFLDVLGERWAANSQADDIVFEVSQQF